MPYYICLFRVTSFLLSVQAIQRQHRFPAQIGIVTSYTKTSDMFNVTTINNIHDQLCCRRLSILKRVKIFCLYLWKLHMCDFLRRSTKFRIGSVVVKVETDSYHVIYIIRESARAAFLASSKLPIILYVNRAVELYSLNSRIPLSIR